MKKIWINKKNHKKCLIFFNGWGMDENTTSHLDVGDYDVCMCYDYSNFEFDDLIFKNYHELYLVAWSMGVFAASQTLKFSKLEFSKKVALNGTERPMDDNFGISVAIFKGTLDNWSVPNRVKFNARVFGGRKGVSESVNRLPKRDSENQRTELRFLFQQITELPESNLAWDCALVGLSDLTITTKNQTNYWSERTRMVHVDVPHFPFNVFSSWQQIIDL